MDQKNARPAQHPIITGEHACNDHIPADRLAAYHKDRKPLSINRKNTLAAEPSIKK